MRRATLFLGTVLALTAAGAASSQPPAAQRSAGMRLEKIVTVSRHGVRSPTKAPEDLARSSDKPWPQWPVAPGILTEHGERDVRLMGQWLRTDYARRGLWPASGCLPTGAVYSWGDAKDQRTRVSGQAMLDGAFPGCSLKAAFGPEGHTDPIFSAASAGACPMDADEARKAILERAGGDLNRLGPGYQAALAALQAIMRPGALPPADSNGLRAGGEDGLRLNGPLSDGSTLSENLFLEYAQGLPMDQVGWGQVGSEAGLAKVMPLHDRFSDLTRVDPYIARHNGALVMRAVLTALEGKPALPGQGGAGTAWTAIAGHDTQLANLSGILGVDWTLAGQPDRTPPDATLVFELWRKPDGGRVVKLALVYQTLDQLRGETRLDAAHPAGRVELAVPDCGGAGGECALAAFETLIASRLPPSCVAGAPARGGRPRAEGAEAPTKP
ncbi:MAG TPA: histidine-type phosphatase [Caulobacteraceae bacterium]|jgi:4-phytase/acid phosphatase